MGIRPTEPITAMRAELKIAAADLTESAYKDQRGRDQVQYALDLEVLSGADDRNGEYFNDWVSFPADEEPSAGSKAGQLLVAALGDDAYTDTPAKEMGPWLVGKTFAAQVGTSKSGKYSRIVHDTIGPAPPESGNGNGSAQPPDDGDGPDSGTAEEDFENIPF